MARSRRVGELEGRNSMLKDIRECQESILARENLSKYLVTALSEPVSICILDSLYLPAVRLLKCHAKRLV